MDHAIDLTKRIPGIYWHAAAILKVELDQIVRSPLEELRIEIGGGAITRRVNAEVGPLINGHETLRMPVRWKAAEHPNLFPVMVADLHVRDLDGDHIELRFVGEYRAPLGAVGAVADTLAGSRLAEKSLNTFLTDVAHRLEAALVEHAPRAGVTPRP
jgi:hypothetical protein